MPPSEAYTSTETKETLPMKCLSLVQRFPPIQRSHGTTQPHLSRDSVDVRLHTLVVVSLVARALLVRVFKIRLELWGFTDSTVVDFEIWTRGSEDDYNRFASVSGDQGWSWNNMMQYLKKVCRQPLLHVFGNVIEQ